MHKDVSGTAGGRRRGQAGSGLPEALVALLLLAIGLLAGASGLLGAVRGSEAALLRSRAMLQAGEFVERLRVDGASGPASGAGGARDAWVAEWRTGVVDTLPRAAADAEVVAAPAAAGLRALRATMGWDDPDGRRATAVVQVVGRPEATP
jgi:Tfp pilus assembly protein PilV